MRLGQYARALEDVAPLAPTLQRYVRDPAYRAKLDAKTAKMRRSGPAVRHFDTVRDAGLLRRDLNEALEAIVLETLSTASEGKSNAPA